MTDPGTFGAFVRDFGLPLAILLIVLTTGARQIWMWGYRLKEEQDHCGEVVTERDKKYDEMVAEKDNRYNEMFAQWEARYGTQVEETVAWRNRYFDLIKLVERNTEANERLIEMVDGRGRTS